MIEMDDTNTSKMREIDIKVLFTGSKTFWRARCNLDLAIVFHRNFDVIQLATADPATGKPLPHIFLCAKTFENAKHTQIDIKTRLNERKEQCLRHHKSYDEGLERKKLLEDMIVQFITSRLNVSGDKNHHQLSLQPHSPDEVSEHDPNSVWVIREKPDELTPYELSCGKVATEGEVDNALYRLQLGTMELKRATVLAKMVADSVDGLKMLLEYRQQYAQKHNRLRVLWWRVIRRVLTQNYVERVKERLLNSSMRDWYVQTLQNTQQQRELAAQLDFAEAEVDTVSIIEHTIPCRRSSLEPIEVTSMNEEQLNRRLDQLAARGAEKRAEKQSLTPRERLAERRRNRYTYDGTPSRPQESHSVNCLLGGNRGQAPHLSPIQGKRHKLNTDPRGASATLSTVRPSTQEGGRREALDSDEDNDMMSSKLTTDARRPQTSCSTSRLAPEDLLNEERERKLRQLAKLCLTPVSQTPNKGKGISPRPS